MLLGAHACAGVKRYFPPAGPESHEEHRGDSAASCPAENGQALVVIILRSHEFRNAAIGNGQLRQLEPPFLNASPLPLARSQGDAISSGGRFAQRQFEAAIRI